MRKFFQIFSIAAVLVLAVCQDPACAQRRSTTRLLYWNIQNGMWSDQGNNYDNFVAFVKELSPDICVWAEGKTHYKTGTAESFKPDDDLYLPSHWAELAARYGHSYVYVGGERDFFPQVITSKYPIENAARLVGDSETVVTHGSGWAKVKVGRKEINIVTVHTWPQKYGFNVSKEDRDKSIAAHDGDRCRAQELKYVYEHTYGSEKNASEGYWIMLGDFNSRSRRDNHHYGYPEDDSRFWAQDYMIEGTELIDVIWSLYGTDFQPSHFGGSRIDYVYCNPNLFDHLKEAYVLRKGFPDGYRDPQGLSNFWHPSDHLPIVVEFLLK